MKKEKLQIKELTELFFSFFIIGATLFGGGYAIIPVIERELIKKRKWTTIDEVIDFFAITQITPGIIAVNMATFIGFKRNGIAGGLVATLGLILPGVVLMIIISVFIKQAGSNEIVEYAFTGIRIAVCALILDTLIKLIKGVIKNYKSVILIIIAFVLSFIFSVSPVLIITGSVLAGLFLFYIPNNRKFLKHTVAADSCSAAQSSHEEKSEEDSENKNEEKENEI